MISPDREEDGAEPEPGHSNSTDSDVNRLALLSQQGCLDSFEKLVVRFERPLLAFISKRVGHSGDAEDLTQEAFVKAYRGLHRFDGRYSFVTWLFTIARRTALNHLRSRARTGAMDKHVPDVEERTPATELGEQESLNEIWRVARQALNPAQLEVLWLRYGQEFSVVEISRIMDCTETRVRVLLHRARARLAKFLRKEIP